MFMPNLQTLARQAQRRIAAAWLVRQLAWRSAVFLVIAVAASTLEGFTRQPLLAILCPLSGMMLTLGLVYSLRQIPRRRQVLILLDEQFGLHELLSTAYAIPQAIDAFAAAVVAQAESAAAQVRQRRVDAGGYAARYWIMAMVCLGLLPMTHAMTRAPAPGDDVPGTQPTPAGLAEQKLDPQSRQAMLLRQSKQFTGETPESPGGEHVTNAPQTQDTPPGQATARPTRSESAGKSPGGGMAVGHPSLTPPPDWRPAGSDHRPGNDPSASTGGGAKRTDNGARDPTGAVSQERTVRPPTANQKRTDAPNAEGNQGINAQSMPDEYQDVIRRYFR